jgi:uncharacterized protein YecT (DUF1311 family)
MRKDWLFTFLLLASICNSARSQRMNDPDAPCKDKVVTVESANCLYTAWKKADQNLNDIYSAVRRVLEPDEIENLRIAQRLWLQFRDANCAAEKALYDGGTAIGPVYNACMEAVTRRRVAELNAMYGWRIEKFQSLYPPDSAPPDGNCAVRDASTRPDCPQAILFFEKLRAALKTGNREMVVSYVDYPLLVNHGNAHSYIQNRTELLKNFDKVFDPRVLCAILGSNARQVWSDSNGFSIGHGEIWFEGIVPATEIPNPSAPDYWSKYPIKLITVNNDSGGTPCKIPN